MPLVRNSNPEVDSTSTRMRCAFSSTRAPTKAENPSVAAQPAQLAARQSHRRSWLHPLKMLMGMLAKLNYAPKRLGAKPIVKSINPSLPRLRSPLSCHRFPCTRDQMLDQRQQHKPRSHILLSLPCALIHRRAQPTTKYGGTRSHHSRTRDRT